MDTLPITYRCMKYVFIALEWVLGANLRTRVTGQSVRNGFLGPQSICDGQFDLRRHTSLEREAG